MRVQTIPRVVLAGGPASLSVPAPAARLACAGLCRSRPFGVSGPRDNGPEIFSSHSQITSKSGLRNAGDAEPRDVHPNLQSSTLATDRDLPTIVQPATPCLWQPASPVHPSQHRPEVSIPSHIVLCISDSVTLANLASITLFYPASITLSITDQLQGIHSSLHCPAHTRQHHFAHPRQHYPVCVSQHHAICINSITLSLSARPACSRQAQTGESFLPGRSHCPPLTNRQACLFTPISSCSAPGCR